jgi:hypothetical protein
MGSSSHESPSQLKLFIAAQPVPARHASNVPVGTDACPNGSAQQAARRETVHVARHMQAHRSFPPEPPFLLKFPRRALLLSALMHVARAGNPFTLDDASPREQCGAQVQSGTSRERPEAGRLDVEYSALAWSGGSRPWTAELFLPLIHALLCVLRHRSLAV